MNTLSKIKKFLFIGLAFLLMPILLGLQRQKNNKKIIYEGIFSGTEEAHADAWNVLGGSCGSGGSLASASGGSGGCSASSCG